MGGVSVLKSLESGNRVPGMEFRGLFRKAMLAGFTLWNAPQWVRRAGLGTTAAFGEPCAEW